MGVMIIPKGTDFEDLQTVLREIDSRLFHYEAYLNGLTEFVSIDKYVLKSAGKMLDAAKKHINLMKMLIEGFMERAAKGETYTPEEVINHTKLWQQYLVELQNDFSEWKPQWEGSKNEN